MVYVQQALMKSCFDSRLSSSLIKKYSVTDSACGITDISFCFSLFLTQILSRHAKWTCTQVQLHSKVLFCFLCRFRVLLCVQFMSFPSRRECILRNFQSNLLKHVSKTVIFTFDLQLCSSLQFMNVYFGVKQYSYEELFSCFLRILNTGCGFQQMNGQLYSLPCYLHLVWKSC